MSSQRRVAASNAPLEDVAVVRHEAEERVDVAVAGQPFTSYRWAANLKKPVLYPIRDDRGTLVTRGWPLEPRPNEPSDHPHHVGMWLSYGDVAGVDFWGHSEKNSSPDKGLIVHRAVTRAEGGHGRGVLDVSCDWLMPDHHVALKETTHYAFGAAKGRRVIDRVTTLAAPVERVSFPDNKEGVFGLRVDHALEHPGEKNPTGTGHYVSSEAFEGEAVWGTRGRWLMLHGTLAGAPLTIAMLDHPKNPGFPTYWHARTWGLMAANPLGQKALSKGQDVLAFAIEKGSKARFAFRVLIVAGHATPAEMEDEYRQWVKAER